MLKEKSLKMLVTDANNLEAGAKDFIYVCRKRPFAITCSPYFQKISETYIDLDLVLKMDIPIKNFQCTRINISGHSTRIVGQISQTVQCVVSGKLCGTSHLKAKVVRDLAKTFNSDCIAGQQLSKKLMDATAAVTVPSKRDKSEDHSTTNKGTVDIYTNISHVIANSAHEDETPSGDDEAASEASHDSELLNFLSTQDEVTREDTFAEYPELSRLSRFFTRKSSDQLQQYQAITDSNRTLSKSLADEDKDLLNYLSTQDERTRDQTFEEYPELARLSKFFTRKSIEQPKPAVIFKDQAITDSTRPAIKSGVSRSAQASPELVQVPSPQPAQPVFQSLPAAAVPSVKHGYTLAAFAASLPVGPTDAYIAALNAPAEEDEISDTSSVTSLARAHGYNDDGPSNDAPAQLNSYAMPCCMLCEVSGQPDTITFSHDTDDPRCPSNYNDDDEEEEDPGGRR